MIEENNTKEKKRAYISGKTTSVPLKELQSKFKKAELYLQNIGMLPVNPLNNSCNENQSKREHLIKDLELLLKSDCILILNKWIDSKQSEIELKIAEEYDIPIIFESNDFINNYKANKIKDAIKKVLGLSFEDYITKSRNQNLFYARMIFIHHCRESEKMGLAEIAKILNRNHTTMLHALNTYKNEIKYNASFRENVSKINLILTKKVSE